jgi:hypothetical protein
VGIAARTDEARDGNMARAARVFPARAQRSCYLNKSSDGTFTRKASMRLPDRFVVQMK